MKSRQIESVASWTLGLSMLVGSITVLAIKLWITLSCAMAYPILVGVRFQSAKHALFYVVCGVAWLVAGILAEGFIPWADKNEHASAVRPASETIWEDFGNLFCDSVAEARNTASDCGRILSQIFLILCGPYALAIVLLMVVPGSLLTGDNLGFQLLPNARKFYLRKTRAHSENAQDS